MCLYSIYQPSRKRFQIRRTKYAGHCWRSKNELISDILQLIPSHGRASVERPARTSQQQLTRNTGCSLNDLPEYIDLTLCQLVSGGRQRQIPCFWNKADGIYLLFIYKFFSWQVWHCPAKADLRQKSPQLRLGPLSGGVAASLTPLSPLYSTDLTVQFKL